MSMETTKVWLPIWDYTGVVDGVHCYGLMSVAHQTWSVETSGGGALETTGINGVKGLGPHNGITTCDGLNENGPHELKCLSAWSPLELSRKIRRRGLLGGGMSLWHPDSELPASKINFSCFRDTVHDVLLLQLQLNKTNNHSYIYSWKYSLWDSHLIGKHGPLSDQWSALRGKLGGFGDFFSWQRGHERDIVPIWKRSIVHESPSPLW